MPTIEEFKSEIATQLRQAQLGGFTFLDVNAGNLHRKLGGYPKPKNQMPSCCGAMYAVVKAGDEVVSSPPKGKGATLTIRYQVPR